MKWSIIPVVICMITAKLSSAQLVKTDANLLKLKCPDTLRTEFITTKGNFTVEVYRQWLILRADR